MPFTAAHPLAVLPFARVRRLLALDTTCLVVGSMTPDFEYFVRGEEVSTISHTLRGVALFDVPMAILVVVAWHGLVKWPVLAIAPRRLAPRLVPLLAAPLPRGTLAIAGAFASMAIGALTHLVWDGMTHAQGYGPHHFPVLEQPIDVPLHGPMVLFRFLQHASTVVGLVALAVTVALLVRRQRPIEVAPIERAWPRVIFAIVVPLGIAVVTARVVWIVHANDIGSVVVAIVAGALAGTLVASALVHRRVRAWRTRVESARP